MRVAAEFGRGNSVDNLEAFRQFYLDYPQPVDNSETASRKLSAAQWRPGALNPALSWSHYRLLLRVGRTEARGFFEIKAIRNAWAVRELERQISSLLFDRLAKSRDKIG